MTPQQMIDQVKLKLNDEIEPRAFTDADILTALNDAQNEFAQRTLCLFEGDGAVTIAASASFVGLPIGVLWLTSAGLPSVSLRILTQHELDYGYFELSSVEVASRFSNWRQAEGTPAFCLPDYGTQNMRIVPKPVVDTDIALEYYRLPTALIALAPEVNAEIPALYHSDLIIGALAYLYDIPDQETYDAEMAISKQVLWQKRVAIAARLLQTVLRMQVRHLTPPPGVGFVLPTGE